MRNKNKSEKHLPPAPLCFSGLIFTPDFSTSSPRAAQGDREQGLHSVHHVLSLLLLPPHAPLLMLSVGSLPQGHRSCQQTCSSMGSSPRGHRCCWEAAPAWAPLHGATAADRSLLQHGLSMGSQLPSGTSTCSNVGSSMGCRWMSAPPWTSMGCRGTTCLTMAFTTGCKGISAPAPGAPPPSPSSLT